ncbi:hypothetical protein E4P24_15625 [Haloferax sp. AS1]|uniref:hypothetical protein n=1 Tax=Haloferax sp. AS1 TaxID=2562277 RepID=UPI00165FC8E6|nr:hypothetical protein [Haloferax sp. AS1]MBC9987789.1 hypothetical protein [Haloferax sp. AS1]
MVLHVRQTVSEGLGRVLTRNGVLLMATFFVAAVLQSAFVWVLATTYVPLGMAGAASPPGTPTPGAALPSLVSASAALLGGLTGGVLTVPIQIVAVRSLVDDGRDHLPEQLVFRTLGWATLRLFIATLLRVLAMFVLIFLVVIVVTLGTVGVFAVLPESLRTTLVGAWYTPLLVVPAILVGLLPVGFVLLTFAFVEQEIAVRDATVTTAFVQSWRTVAGNRLRLGAALIVPYGINMAFSLLLGQVMPDATFGSPTFLLTQTALSVESSIISIVVLGITSQAWIQLTGVDGPLADYWTGGTADSQPSDEGATRNAVE